MARPVRAASLVLVSSVVAIILQGCGAASTAPPATTGPAATGVAFTFRPDSTVAPTEAVVTQAPAATPAPTPTAIAVATPIASTCPGLVGWWPGEGSAEDVIGTNEGALEGGVAFAPGKVGQAFSFDGIDDVVRVSNHASLNPAGSFTFEAWVQAGAFKSAQVGIIEKWGDTSNWVNQRAYDLAMFSDGRMRFGIQDRDTQKSQGFPVLDTPTGSASSGDWHHIAWVYDRVTGARFVYVDGKVAGERTDTAIGSFDTAADLGFGAVLRAPNTSQFFFAGLIDEIQYFDRTQSAAEVAAAFAAGSAGTCR